VLVLGYQLTNSLLNYDHALIFRDTTVYQLIFNHAS
jgi:hypothetical protein